MKKFLTFVLVLAMVLSVSSFAMAAFLGDDTLNNATHAVSLTVGTDKYYYETLQAAITDAQNNPGVITITFLKDISESVVVVQKPGLDLTIDGDGHKMTKSSANGSIEIHGESRDTGTDTLKIQNIVFDIDGDLGGDNAVYDCIHCNKTTENARYAHNVTVEKCTFDFEGVTSGAAVAARFRQCYDIVITGCEVKGGHSLLQSINSHGVEVKETKISGCEEGINLNNSTDATIADCDIDVTGYGVRGGEKYSATGDVTIIGTTIKAKRPIIMRWQATLDAYTLNIKDEGNALTPAIGEEPIHVTLGDDDNYNNTNLNQDGSIVAWNENTNTYYTGKDKAIKDAGDNDYVYPVVNGDVDRNNPLKKPTPSASPSSEPTTNPSSGGGYYFVGVRYNGGNSFSTDRSDVPVAVLIDGQPVGFTGNGSNFVVDCINPGASRITIVWNTIKVDARFTPDANAYCAQTVIPKTGGMSIWAAIAQFLGF